MIWQLDDLSSLIMLSCYTGMTRKTCTFNRHMSAKGETLDIRYRTFFFCCSYSFYVNFSIYEGCYTDSMALENKFIFSSREQEEQRQTKDNMYMTNAVSLIWRYHFWGEVIHDPFIAWPFFWDCQFDANWKGNLWKTGWCSG